MKKMKLDIQLFGLTTTLTASQKAIDETAIQNNQSYISLSIREQTTSPTWNGEKSAYYQVTTTSQNNGTQTGSKYYFSIGSSSGSGDKTFNVTLGPFDHNPDGTLNNVSISVYTRITSSTTNTKTKSVAMTTIPRASVPTLSSSSVNMNSSVTINTNRYSSSFTHTITYAFGNASGTIGTNVGDSISWTPPLSLANQIPNATSGGGTITCITYNGGTEVGRKSIGITLNVPSSVAPTISSRTISENGLTPSAWNTYVKSKSKVRVQTTASGAYGSTISSIVTTIDGYTYTGADITSNYLNSTGTLAVLTKATDSRGRVYNLTTNISVVDYTNPSFTSAQVQRCDVNGNINASDDAKKYVKYVFAGSVASCSGNNKGTFKIKYKLHSASTYTDAPTIASNVQSVNTNGFIVDGNNNKVQFSTGSTYDFMFTIQDTFMTSSNSQSLGTGFDLMNFNANGKAMAIGKFSEATGNNSLFEVGMPTNIIGATNITGDLNVNGKIYNIRFLDLTSLSSSTFYPLVFQDTDNPINVYIKSQSGSASASYNQNRIIFTLSGRGWSDTPRSLFVKEYKCYTDNEVTIGCIGSGTAGGYRNCVWLRGGLTYDISSSANFELKTSNATYGTEVYSVGTNYYGGTNSNVEILFTPQSTITNGAYLNNNLKAYQLFAGHCNRNTTDTWVPIVGPNGRIDYTTRYMPNTKTHAQYNTEQDRLVTLNMLSYWNGAYDGANGSNLTYSMNGQIVGMSGPITSGTSGLTRTSGSSSLVSVEWVKWGRMITLRVAVKTTAQVNSGTDIMGGNIIDGLKPLTNDADGLGYYAGRCIAFRVRNAGTFTIRNAGYATSGIGSGSTISCSVTYISAS